MNRADESQAKLADGCCEQIVKALIETSFHIRKIGRVIKALQGREIPVNRFSVTQVEIAVSADESDRVLVRR